MPISCPAGGEPKYRVKGKVRLAFCDNKVVEAKKLAQKAKAKKKLGS